VTATFTTGGAISTVGPGSATVPQAQRDAVNASLSAYIEKTLGSVVGKSVGTGVDLKAVALLTVSLKTGLRAKIGTSLGVSGGISAGGVGGTAGGGNQLATGAGSPASTVGGATGRVGGVVAGGVSLRASLGASGSPVQFGQSSTGNFGVGASSGLSSKSGLSMTAGASIKSSLSSALDTAMAQNGLSGSQRSAMKSDLLPAMNSAVDNSLGSAFGPDLVYPNAAGVPLLSAHVTMQDRGTWHAHCEIDHPSDDAQVVTGPFTFNIDNVEFRGTVVPDRSGVQDGTGGRQQLYVVGGAGGLDTEIQVRNYASGQTRAQTIIEDILRDSGESLSTEADQTYLNKRVTGWQRAAGKAQLALDQICEAIGAQWRVLRDGTVWIGQDQWPEIEPSGTVEGQDWASGSVTVAPDFPTLVPGVIVRGQQIHQVEHHFGDDGKLRTECRAKSHRQLVDGFLDRAQRKNVYGYRYRCTVKNQNDDGTVDVVTDDEKMKGKGVSKCRMRFGLPGVTAKVSNGARCLLGWDDADPSLPYVSDFESAAAFITIDIA
jgi:hypothetical protein